MKSKEKKGQLYLFQYNKKTQPLFVWIIKSLNMWRNISMKRALAYVQKNVPEQLQYQVVDILKREEAKVQNG